MRHHRLPTLLCLLSLLLIGCTPPDPMPALPPDAPSTDDLLTAAAPYADAWVPLFNGQDLTGWTPKIRGYALGDNYGDTFRVEEGHLVVRYDAYDAFDARYGHLFYKEPYSHYIIAVEYRFEGEQAPGGEGWALRNSGIMVHGQPPETMLRDQDFPISIEVQLLGGNGTDARTTANLCTPGTHVVMGDLLETAHCINAASATYHGEQWVRVEVVVLGHERITHRVNGEEVITYTLPQVGGGVVNGFDPASKADGTPLGGGSISLQSESHPIAFRKVELLDLVGCTTPGDPNYRPYFVHHDAGRCGG